MDRVPKTLCISSFFSWKFPNHNLVQKLLQNRQVTHVTPFVLEVGARLHGEHLTWNGGVGGSACAGGRVSEDLGRGGFAAGLLCGQTRGTWHLAEVTGWLDKVSSWTSRLQVPIYQNACDLHSLLVLRPSVILFTKPQAPNTMTPWSLGASGRLTAPGGHISATMHLEHPWR